MPVDALVARARQPEALRDLRVGRRRVHERHAAVRHLRGHRAQRHHDLRARVLRDLHEQVGEPSPAIVRLDARQQHQLAARVVLVVGVDGVLGPHDRPGDAVAQHDIGTHLLRVEERVTVDRRQPGAPVNSIRWSTAPRRSRRGVEVSGEREHEDRRARRPPAVPDQLARLAHAWQSGRCRFDPAPRPRSGRGSVAPMEGTVLALGVVVAFAAAVRSTWSPCGQSMLSQLTPVGEASRGYRYRTTATWFVVGAVVGGANPRRGDGRVGRGGVVARPSARPRCSARRRVSQCSVPRSTPACSALHHRSSSVRSTSTARPLPRLGVRQRLRLADRRRCHHLHHDGGGVPHRRARRAHRGTVGGSGRRRLSSGWCADWRCSSPRAVAPPPSCSHSTAASTSSANRSDARSSSCNSPLPSSPSGSRWGSRRRARRRRGARARGARDPRRSSPDRRARRHRLTRFSHRGCVT